jgi:hypothetical protein
LAIPFHIMRGEANVIALHIGVVCLCTFVGWGGLTISTDATMTRVGKLPTPNRIGEQQF